MSESVMRCARLISLSTAENILMFWVPGYGSRTSRGFSDLEFIKEILYCFYQYYPLI